MSRIFVSYSRENEPVVNGLAGDLEAMGHDVWIDHELSGGQNWWDKILAQIRECDVFVFALAPASVNSTACKREYTYAVKLGKPILPALVTDGVSTNALPPALSAVQFVDYRQPDRTTALRLSRALSSTPPAPPLPDPLPEAPKVPLSYLGGLREQLDSESAMTLACQSTLLFELKRSLRDAGTRDDGLSLLRLFRQRGDLLAKVAEEIDVLLDQHSGGPEAAGLEFLTVADAIDVRGGEGGASAPVLAPPDKARPVASGIGGAAAAPAMEPANLPAPAVSEPVQPPPASVAARARQARQRRVSEPGQPPARVQRSGPTWTERLKAAGIAGAVGAVMGTIAWVTGGGTVSEAVGMGIVWTGPLTAVAFLIAGYRRRVRIAAFVGGGILAVLFVLFGQNAALGFPVGAVPGAIVGALIERAKSRHAPPQESGAEPLPS